MSQARNIQEIKWLHEQPERLLEVYQPVIEVIIYGFVKKGFFQAAEKMEVLQEVNLQLLEVKLEKIRQYYEGSALLRTYFSKVVNNTCIDIIRKQNRKTNVESADFLLYESDKTPSPQQQLILKEEALRLEACLTALPRQRLKATLCLKAISRIPFTREDIQFLESPKTQFEIKAIRQTFFENYENLSHIKVFEILTPLFNKIENKDLDADSLRRWTNHILDRFVFILNGDPPHAAYTRETLKILIRFMTVKI